MVHTAAFAALGALASIGALLTFRSPRRKAVALLALGPLVAIIAGWSSLLVFSYATANVPSLAIALVSAALVIWPIASRRASQKPERTSTTATGGAIGNIPALDGIRGIAILLVLMEHSWIPTWTEPHAGAVDQAVSFVYLSGWSGVDLFFVLSGFLITTILWESRKQERYFRTFYFRRVLRIFPLYYGILILYFIVGPHLPGSIDLGDAGKDQAWYWLYMSNVSMARTGNFAPSALGVSWSLAIEEQFYWVWPPIVLLLNRRHLIRLCIALIGAAFLWRLVLVTGHVNPQSVYVLLPTQMDALAAGALIALILQNPAQTNVARRTAPWIGAVSLSVFIALGAHAAGATYAFFEGDPLMQTVGYSALVAFFACLVLVASTGMLRRFGSTVLESRPIRAAGKYSYGMYLLHRPVLAFLAVAVTPWLISTSRRTFGFMAAGQLVSTLIFIAATASLAWVSWNYYESVFLRLKRFVGYRPSSRANDDLLTPGATKQVEVARAPVVVSETSD